MTVYQMASEDEKKAAFDAEAAKSTVKELRSTFGSGKTKSYDWRVSQLKNMLKFTDDHEKDIIDALRSDLAKPELESFAHEVLILILFCFVFSLSLYSIRF